jgi:hypothetical protein
VIANGMAACYSLLQGARCLVSMLTGGVLVSRPLAWAIFSCDQASILIFICRHQGFKSLCSLHVLLSLSIVTTIQLLCLNFYVLMLQLCH